MFPKYLWLEVDQNFNFLIAFRSTLKTNKFGMRLVQWLEVIITFQKKECNNPKFVPITSQLIHYIESLYIENWRINIDLWNYFLKYIWDKQFWLWQQLFQAKARARMDNIGLILLPKCQFGISIRFSNLAYIN